MKKMKDSMTEEQLYLDYFKESEGYICPLHTSVSLFLLSYCDCKLFKVFLVSTGEVSQWTRLCEISIPLAVERFLGASPEQHQPIPPDILLLEKKLGEPVRVHNDDKIRRQKLKQQKAVEKNAGPTFAKRMADNYSPEEGTTGEIQEQSLANLELRVAFSKLTVHEVPAATNREPSHIRKARASDLPSLEHIFAEGLFFTLADMVLLPCIHPFLVFCKKHKRNLSDLPLISSWYQRVQEVPGIMKAAAKSNMQFFQFAELPFSPNEWLQDSCAVSDGSEEDHEDNQFIGGPRPTMTKLMENGIEAKFSPHPCPSWALDWNSLPAAVNPGEGRISPPAP
uniref:Glutathione S-transferase C-terminal domain containing n=1 Tax=Sphenodon punctatus TaxID=8508 RepID=A0A8D0L557_SPHPU